MSIHDGHRERMKKQFAVSGLDGFDDINALELLLFYAMPRRDTNAVAHALLDRFDSLDAVLEATVPELMRVDGVGENTAVFLRLVPQVSRRYMMRKGSAGPVLCSSGAAGAYVTPLFMYEKDEVVYLICLDSKRKVLSCEEIGRGEVNRAEVSIRRIIERALSHGAVSVILAHNHTSGIALPSREDESTTKRIMQALSLVNISLADHIIVADDDYVSMADSGILSQR